MPSYVVDACVAVKWLVPELHHDKAKRFLTAFLDHQEVELMAPDLIVVEVGSALRRKVLDGEISADQASEAYKYFLALPLPLCPSSSIAARALALAIKEQRSIYIHDVLYVALAEEKDCDLITSDEKLIEQLSGKFSFIRRLADF